MAITVIIIVATIISGMLTTTATILTIITPVGAASLHAQHGHPNAKPRGLGFSIGPGGRCESSKEHGLEEGLGFGAEGS